MLRFTRADSHKVRQAAPKPEDLKKEAREGLLNRLMVDGTDLVHTHNGPKRLDSPAPGPATWNENQYVPHGDGTPLPEHPVNVGTPRPATISTYGIMMFLVLGLCIGAWYAVEN